MLVVALTGGIGSGKSTVSRHFEALGVPVIDADIIAREQVLPGSPALAEISRRFGREIITHEGSLERSRLRALVFADPEKRRELEQILHPRIAQEMQRRLQDLNSPYAILVIPLLLEAGQTHLADRILVVDCPEQLRSVRVQKRDGLTQAQIEQIFTAQTDQAARLSLADDVIENAGDMATLTARIDRLHHFYLQLAEKAAGDTGHPSG